MFFYKYIRQKPFFNETAIFLINFFIKLVRYFIPNGYNDTEKVVIIAVQRLGDSIFTMPAIKQIINYHRTNIYLVCFNETIPIFEIVFNSIEFIPIYPNDFQRNNKIVRTRVRTLLNKLKPETIYDLTGNATSASILLLSTAKKIIGVNEIYYKAIYTNYRNIRAEPHLIDNYLDAIRGVIPVSDIIVTPLNFNPEKKFILIHPFASHNAKEWGLKNYLKLAEVLNRKYNCMVVFPPKRITIELINEMKKNNISYAETETTKELIATIQDCFLFIGNDSGPIHIANLLGKPTFTIYGPTNPNYHKPLAGINEYIINGLKCTPQNNDKFCFTLGGVFCPSNECMKMLKFEEVENRINRYINFLIN